MNRPDPKKAADSLGMAHVNGMVVLDNDDVMEIDGQSFVRLAKRLLSTCRMLGFKTGDGRPLSRTSIIETIIELRDEEHRKHCAQRR